MPRNVYFTSDVHLGLKLETSDPAEREARFLAFLRSLNAENAKALYLLGDIWDFWYEYRDLVPRIGFRVVAELSRLVNEGVEVFFFEGNHDIWTYSFFESLGIKKLHQPAFVTIDGKVFCLGHGDMLGGARFSYRFVQKIFHCRFLQKCFNTIHPWLAYRFGLGWSNSNRKSHKHYVFRNEEEPIYKFALGAAADQKVDYFIFGHFHCSKRLSLPGGEEFIILNDWMKGGVPYAEFNGSSVSLHS